MRLSLIVVVYNNLEGITEVIEIIKQISIEYRKLLEIIVVDGDSNDGTKELLKSNDGVINTLITEPDTGIYNAMNKGLKYAEGEYVYFWNSDDIIVLDKLYELLCFLDRKHDYFAFGYIRESKKGGRFIAARDIGDWRECLDTPFKHPGLCIKKDVYHMLNGFNEHLKISADTEFIIRLLKTPELSGLVIKKPFYLNVFRHGGVSSKVMNFKEHSYIIKKHLTNKCYLDLFYTYLKRYVYSFLLRLHLSR